MQMVDQIGVGAEPEAEDAREGGGSDPQGVVLGEGVQMLHRRLQDADR
jgi:hypothetical protein